jgi:Biotin/lipoate A/B protein ligase family
LIGGGRLAWPDGIGADDRPDWLVFSAMVRAGGVRDLGAGAGPEITTLDEEGFDAWNPESFSASFARNFLVEIDQWGERGFTQIGPRYLSRLEKTKHVQRRAIDTNGDLLIYFDGVNTAQRHAFEDGLKAAQWYDPQLNEPRE